jgi:hypothetical protein
MTSTDGSTWTDETEAGDNLYGIVCADIKVIK